jgi:hypothetical protein
MIHALVSMYESGAITADHLVAQCLHSIDPLDPGLVLAHLPDSILPRVQSYCVQYRSGRMVSTHPLLPAQDQVDAASRWVESQAAMARAT